MEHDENLYANISSVNNAIIQIVGKYKSGHSNYRFSHKNQTRTTFNDVQKV